MALPFNKKSWVKKSNVSSPSAYQNQVDLVNPLGANTEKVDSKALHVIYLGICEEDPTTGTSKMILELERVVSLRSMLYLWSFHYKKVCLSLNWFP